VEAQEVGYVLPVDAWAALAALQGAASFWALEGQEAPDAAKGWAWLLDAELAQETPEHMLVEPVLLALAAQMAKAQDLISFQRGRRAASLFRGPDFALVWESLPGGMVRATPFPTQQAAVGSLEERIFASSDAPVHACCRGGQGVIWERHMSREELRAL